MRSLLENCTQPLGEPGSWVLFIPAAAKVFRVAGRIQNKSLILAAAELLVGKIADYAFIFLSYDGTQSWFRGNDCWDQTASLVTVTPRAEGEVVMTSDFIKYSNCQNVRKWVYERAEPRGWCKFMSRFLSVRHGFDQIISKLGNEGVLGKPREPTWLVNHTKCDNHLNIIFSSPTWTLTVRHHIYKLQNILWMLLRWIFLLFSE